jgi:ornithine--oxo-acid transaminase
MTKTNAIVDKNDQYGAHNYKPLPVVLERGEGVWVWDVEGHKYMDMLSAYSAMSLGHCHPKVIEALKAQADKLTLVSRAFFCDHLGEMYERLVKLSGLPRVLPMNTGAEAVETAIKAVRKWGYTVKGVPENQAEIIACNDNFHGRTTTVISFSSEADYRAGFGPFTPGFKLVDYGSVEAIKAAITPNTVAVLVEPIQGEAGIKIPPVGYLEEVAKLCQDNQVLLALDEIQTGFARTGKMFCFEHDGVKPDVLILGKALGGGVLPVSAVVATDEVMNVFQPGQHGSTFGGNPLSAAVAVAALDVMVDENLSERSHRLGGYLMEKLHPALESPHVKEIRGRGLFIGIELKPEAGGARRFCEALMGDGLLCKETHESVIRLAPPLVITEEEIDWAVERVNQALLG